MKTCPYCAEDIQDAAIVCKHCRRDLPAAPPRISSGAVPGIVLEETVHASAPIPTARPAKKTSLATWLALAFFVFIGFAWVNSLLNPPPTPSSYAATSASQAPAATPKLALLSMVDSGEHDYLIVEGEVKNLSSESLRNVTAVTTWYDAADNFITSDQALIDYNPLLPGQTSPYKTMTRRNPAMSKYRVTFKHLTGGAISTDDQRKPSTK